MIKPAKLKSISKKIWELEKPGEFGSNYYPQKTMNQLNLQLRKNDENYAKLAEQLSELQKKYTILESKIPKSSPPRLPNSQPASSSQKNIFSTSQSIENTVELSIMNYLKKHGASTYYQLRLGIECEEQILSQSLIKLGKGEYIIAEILPDHSILYKIE